MYIYKTINILTNEFYIGKSKKNINESRNYYGSGIHLKRAIQKYGKSNFKKEIIEECSSIEQLNEREKFWIEQLDAINSGYNISIGGDGGPNFLGKKHTKETLEKISCSITKSQTGKHLSEERKRNISKAMIGNKSFKGKKLSESHKENIRQGLLKRRNNTG